MVRVWPHAEKNVCQEIKLLQDQWRRLGIFSQIDFCSAVFPRGHSTRYRCVPPEGIQLQQP